MLLKDWDDLPIGMKNDSVRKYYDSLHKKRFSLYIKRLFDLLTGILTLIILSPVFLIIGIVIKKDSPGPVFFRQTRVTQYGREFEIFKFRTMVNNADKVGPQVTIVNDNRVTKVGGFLRKYRLDEIPQLFNIITGDMSFVGTRPEVPKYVEKYSEEMMATLLLPAGVTSEASINFKNEESMLLNADNVEEIYIDQVLPMKMEYNLRSLENYNFSKDIKTMFMTVLAVNKKSIKMPEK